MNSLQSVKRDMLIEAPIEKVWSALTEAGQLTRSGTLLFLQNLKCVYETGQEHAKRCGEHGSAFSI